MQPARTSTSSSSPRARIRRHQDWFQAFAGTAFQWSDEAPTKAGSTGAGKITFDVVQQPSGLALVPSGAGADVSVLNAPTARKCR